MTLVVFLHWRQGHRHPMYGPNCGDLHPFPHIQRPLVELERSFRPLDMPVCFNTSPWSPHFGVPRLVSQEAVNQLD